MDTVGRLKLRRKHQGCVGDDQRARADWPAPNVAGGRGRIEGGRWGDNQRTAPATVRRNKRVTTWVVVDVEPGGAN